MEFWKYKRIYQDVHTPLKHSVKSKSNIFDYYFRNIFFLSRGKFCNFEYILRTKGDLEVKISLKINKKCLIDSINNTVQGNVTNESLK